MGNDDRRRTIPRTDALLALPAVVEARARLSEPTVRAVISSAQQAARDGALPVEQVADQVERSLRDRATTSLTPVLNATGVIVHTNLGRAPLSDAAMAAVQSAAGYVDVELDLTTGRRGPRGAAAREALIRACPAAEAALVVNNGAAALLLAITALVGTAEIVVSRGELIEIGAGFRLPDLMAVTGATLREVGTTNRTHADDYAQAIIERTGCLLKVHTSNYSVQGFTAEVDVAALRTLADEHHLPLIVDLGSGLLAPDPALPDEPDADTALRAGADVVIASGDKLLGGPQAGLLLGKAEVIERLALHPLARAVRTDKLTLAALEATLTAEPPPVSVALHADPDRLRVRAEALVARVGGTVVAHDGRVGGGGAPGVPLPGWAVALPAQSAEPLRLGTPAVLARVHNGVCLVDLRCVPEADDERLAGAVAAALRSADD
ncbi:L-seryl-tRNA(Sec) selenium transferase [Micropruina glycogenica]|uniref:L-seryl-tRNA(Sec) selenium transferase n=1 Tax=Micropruina glycogenica TaxID=75385 RepID=A0A2N9JDD7_9ACTN|nr:L-seryl-tRNA(Sec) selenium transferase [Micropruina glycogenica]SPD85539.1 selenocysteine synthase [Micropruina glycogenica]